MQTEEFSGAFQCKVCDFNFRPEFESEMKKRGIAYKSHVQCLAQEKMLNCKEYDPRRRLCVECETGFELKTEVKEIFIESSVVSGAASSSDPNLRRILETTDSSSEKEEENPLSAIDDSAKEVRFESQQSCAAKPDIGHCLEHSLDKEICVLCETGRIFNNRTRECQFLVLVPRGCLKYGPHNSCYRCTKNFFLNEVHDCVAVEKPVPNCHLYNSSQKCSLCARGFALSADKSTCDRVDPMRAFLISFFGNTYNRRKFFSDDLENQILLSSRVGGTQALHASRDWDRLFDPGDVAETALLMENTLRFCVEYKTNDGKCNRCKPGYRQKYGFCVKVAATHIPNCEKYDGKSHKTLAAVCAARPTTCLTRAWAFACRS